MKSFRIVIAVVGAIIIVIGGWLMWRNAHPALTDEQQIKANLQAISQAAERHSSGAILGYLAEGFTWNGQNRHDVASNLSGAMFEFPEVKIQTSFVNVQMQGINAVTTGDYTISIRGRNQTESRIYRGKFKAEWQKQGKQWLITKADSNGESPL